MIFIYMLHHNYYIDDCQYVKKIILSVGFLQKAPYAETENDWKKLLPWNIEITPYKVRGEWI